MVKKVGPVKVREQSVNKTGSTIRALGAVAKHRQWQQCYDRVMDKINRNPDLIWTIEEICDGKYENEQAKLFPRCNRRYKHLSNKFCFSLLKQLYPVLDKNLWEQGEDADVRPNHLLLRVLVAEEDDKLPTREIDLFKSMARASSTSNNRLLSP